MKKFDCSRFGSGQYVVELVYWLDCIVAEIGVTAYLMGLEAGHMTMLPPSEERDENLKTMDYYLHRKKFLHNAYNELMYELATFASRSADIILMQRVG